MCISSRTGGGALMFLFSAGILGANGWCLQQLNVLINDKFGCKSAQNGCGPYGDQLKKVLERLFMLLLACAVANVIAFLAYTLKGLSKSFDNSTRTSYSYSFKFFIIVVTAVASVTATLAYGAAEVNDINFLRSKASEAPHNFNGKTSHLKTAISLNFLGQMLVLVFGHLFAVWASRQRTQHTIPKHYTKLPCQDDYHPHQPAYQANPLHAPTAASPLHVRCHVQSNMH